MFYKNGTKIDDSANLSQAIGDHVNKVYTRDIELSIVVSVEKDDVFELRAQTTSAKTTGNIFYNVSFNARPISLYGNT